MLNEKSVVKVGIFKDGVHVRVIAECDLIEQENGHKEEAIYFFESTFVRDPNLEFTQADINASVKSAAQQLKSQNSTFKVKSREEAEKYITKSTSGSWETIRPISA